MYVYGEFPGQKIFVDGMLMKAIIAICMTQPPERKGIIIFKYRLDELLTDDSDPF